MSSRDHDNTVVAAVPTGAGEAVGLSEGQAEQVQMSSQADRKWYVAIVQNNTEKSVEEKLHRLGHESYVARQTVIRVWKNGRKGKVDKVIIPSMVFVKCTEAERKEIVALPFINRFLTDKAGRASAGHTRPLAIIPQSQIDTLRFMLGQSDMPVTLVDIPYKVHDKIVVVRGSLKGLEGEILETTDGKSELIVKIDILGCAKITIASIDIEPLKEPHHSA